MSTQGTVTDFLKAMKPEATGIIPLTPNSLALQTGIGKQAVSRVLSVLAQGEHPRIELVKSENGREIVGVKPLDLAPRKPGRKPGTQVARTRHEPPMEIMPATRRVKNTVHTPEIDKYAKAKSQFAAIQQEWDGYIQATFTPNPWAEEGLALRDRLSAMESQLIECRVERDEYKKNAEALQAKKQERMKKAAEKSGALAEQAEA